LKAFQFGSRAWGTATAETDWDFFVVIEGYTGPVHPTLDTSLVGCEVDISAYNPAQWRKLLERQNDMLAIVCEHLPAQFRWKDTYDAHPQRHLKQLVRCVSKEMSTCLSMSRNHFPTNPRTSLKNFVHAFRYIGFGTQLATERKLTDLGVANERYKEAMERLAGIESTTYESHSQVYSPQIHAATDSFRKMVHKLIVNELKFQSQLKVPSTTSYEAVEIYLSSKTLDDLYHFFGITNTLISDSVYLLTASDDSPENEPITASCGATLFDLDSKQVVAFPHGFFNCYTIDTLFQQADNLLRSERPIYATVVREGDVEIIMWHSKSGGWNFGSTAFQSDFSCNKTLALDQFRSKFAELSLDYPNDPSLCPSFLFNTQDGEIRPIGVSSAGGTLLDLPQGSTFLNWPTMDLASYNTILDLKSRVSQLESQPLAYRGLLILDNRFGAFIASRSHNALSYIRDSPPEEFKYGSTPATNMDLKYIAIALSVPVLDDSDPAVQLLPPVALASVRDEHQQLLAILKIARFFWDLVKAHADDVPQFVKAMTDLKFWKPIQTAMHSVRQHPSRDVASFLKASPVCAYQYWKSIFHPSKTQKLVDTIASSLKP
jgi:hypothetical protein